MGNVTKLYNEFVDAAPEIFGQALLGTLALALLLFVYMFYRHFRENWRKSKAKELKSIFVSSFGKYARDITKCDTVESSHFLANFVANVAQAMGIKIQAKEGESKAASCESFMQEVKAKVKVDPDLSSIVSNIEAVLAKADFVIEIVDDKDKELNELRERQNTIIAEHKKELEAKDRQIASSRKSDQNRQAEINGLKQEMEKISKACRELDQENHQLQANATKLLNDFLNQKKEEKELEKKAIVKLYQTGLEGVSTVSPGAGQKLLSAQAGDTITIGREEEIYSAKCLFVLGNTPWWQEAGKTTVFRLRIYYSHPDKKDLMLVQKEEEVCLAEIFAKHIGHEIEEDQIVEVEPQADEAAPEQEEDQDHPEEHDGIETNLPTVLPPTPTPAPAPEAPGNPE